MITNSKLAKVAAAAAGLSMAFTAALPAGAVTIAELQAQIAALMAQLQALQSGSTGGTVVVSFSRDLTVGSSGADVTALQQMLVSQGYLTMPAGVAYGYFGALTKSAVARWQAANGLPATGFFGPMSRAKANAVGGTTTGGTTTGGTTTGGTTSGTITTPGAEGDITVTSAPVSDLTLDEGQSMAPVLAFQVRATGSDMAVQRVKLDLGSNTEIYNKILSRVYLTDDAGRTVASADLNSTNVVKDGSNYFITLSGFSSVVPRGSTRIYTVKADVRGTIDSSELSDTRTVSLTENGVRAVDGAGIDSYGPSSALSSSFTVSADPTESATLTVSQSASTPATSQVIAASGTNENEADKVSLLTFNVKAEKDAVKITELTATVAATGDNRASTTVFYLYAGNQLLDSVANTSSATSFDVEFDNLSYTVAKDATSALTISADVRNATTASTTLAVTVNADNIVAEASNGDTIPASRLDGTATGNNIYVLKAGPELSLASKSISKTSNASTGTGTAQGTFNITIRAVGSDVVASTTGAFVFDVYENGVSTTTATGVYSFVNGNGVTVSGNNATITEGTTITLPVNVVYSVGSANTSKLYSFGLDRALMNNMTINYMDGKIEWRTDSVVLP